MNAVFINPNTDFELLKNKLKDAVLVLPKNSGLTSYRLLFEEMPNETITVRAEDVPKIVEKLAKKGSKSFGVTGEDLFKEYQIESGGGIVKQVGKIPWNGSKTLFGKPTLCLLGPKKRSLASFDKADTLTVAINSKYKRISEDYLSKLESQGFKFEKLVLNGCTENTYRAGEADLVIEVVVSGESAIIAGLKVYETILGSDIAILGGSK